MEDTMKHIVKGIAFILAMAASSAQAIPTLMFNGDINFNSTTNILNVTSELFHAENTSTTVNLSNSTLTFDATLTSVTSALGFFSSTIGNFSGITGNDLTIIDGDGITLLTADFSSLGLEGFDGEDSGIISGALTATGGSLINDFNTSDLFALQLNMDTVFSNLMFESNFTGQVNGDLKGHAANVPEPTTMVLLCLGLLMIGFVHTRIKD